ncbi:MAG: hypothetical protein VW907_10365, partial [Opitutae bacterium]
MQSPRVDSWPDGRSVVTWSAFQENFGSQVYAQILDPDGEKVGGQILVCADNGATINGGKKTAVFPDVAVLENGQFVVGWNQGQRVYGGEADCETVFRIFNPDGTAVTPIDAPIIGYDPTDHNGYDLDILALSDGGFIMAMGIVARPEDGLVDGLVSGGDWEVVAQRFDETGTGVGAPIHVNTSTSGTQANPALAELDDGTIMIVWKSESGSAGEIFGQRIGNGGVKIGSEFVVSTSVSGEYGHPDVAVLDDGSILVGWLDSYRGADYYAQRINVDGEKIGTEFKINASPSTIGYQNIEVVPT